MKTYQDYIPPDEGRSYSLAPRKDGTYAITDVTHYRREGDAWGAADANAAVQAGVQFYTHTYNTAAHLHNFAGAGTNGKALVTAEYTQGDTFAVNGAAVEAYTGEYATDALPLGRWVTFVCDGAQLNFKSGGGGFNFKVIAVAGETDADLAAYATKPNVLAVVTQQSMDGWAFMIAAPPDPHEGLVWIVTGLVSSNTFNAVRKQRLDVSPLTARQYQDGAWVNRTLLLRKNGVWEASAFTVKYLPGEYGTFAPQTYINCVYGTETPAFSGTATGGNADYTFDGWWPPVAATATEHVSYTAKWKLTTFRYFKPSDPCTALTGGWIGNPGNGGTSGYGVYVGTDIRMARGSATPGDAIGLYWASAYTRQRVDVTNLTTLYFTAQYGGAWWGENCWREAATVGLSSGQASTGFVAAAGTILDQSQHTYAVNVASLNGSYFISMLAKNNVAMEYFHISVTNIWGV